MATPRNLSIIPDTPVAVKILSQTQSIFDPSRNDDNCKDRLLTVRLHHFSYHGSKKSESHSPPPLGPPLSRLLCHRMARQDISRHWHKCQHRYHLSHSDSCRKSQSFLLLLPASTISTWNIAASPARFSPVFAAKSKLGTLRWTKGGGRPLRVHSGHASRRGLGHVPQLQCRIERRLQRP